MQHKILQGIFKDFFSIKFKDKTKSSMKDEVINNKNLTFKDNFP